MTHALSAFPLPDPEPARPAVDATLVSRAKLGDIQAFEAIVTRYYARCMRFAHGMLRDAADADDSSGPPDITDAVAILSYLFLGAADPASPGPRACGNARIARLCGSRPRKMNHIGAGRRMSTALPSLGSTTRSAGDLDAAAAVNGTLLAAVTSARCRELEEMLELFTSRAGRLLADEQATTTRSHEEY